MKKDPQALIESYWTQLEAYVFAFENPLVGESMPIKSIGLLQWRIDDSMHQEDLRGFTVEHRYIPIPRRQAQFQEFLAKFIGIIEGEFPDAGLDCETCGYLDRIGYNFN